MIIANTLMTSARKGLARALFRASRFVYDTQFREDIVVHDGEDELAVFEIVGDDYGAGLTGSSHLPDELDRLGLSVNVFEEEGVLVSEYDLVTGKWIDLEGEL